jgi:hypothetical protein
LEVVVDDDGFLSPGIPAALTQDDNDADPEGFVDPELFADDPVSSAVATGLSVLQPAK